MRRRFIAAHACRLVVGLIDLLVLVVFVVKLGIFTLRPLKAAEITLHMVRTITIVDIAFIIRRMATVLKDEGSSGQRGLLTPILV